MSLTNKIIANISYTFITISIVYTVLCHTGLFTNLFYLDVTPTFLVMSIGTAVFTTLREHFLPNLGAIKYFIEIIGYTLIIYLTIYCFGWFTFSISYLLIILGMTLVVYLITWCITWIQSKHDEENLNALLNKSTQQSDKNHD